VSCAAECGIDNGVVRLDGQTIDCFV